MRIHTYTHTHTHSHRKAEEYMDAMHRYRVSGDWLLEKKIEKLK